MELNDKDRPPRWATSLLGWYCRREILEDLQGDLNEYFARNVKEKGPFRARIIYIMDVLKFFRTYTIRRPKILNLLTHWIMIGSYIRTSGRNIVRNRLFSFINIAGLAVSMTVGMIMIGVLKDALSYDKFHENHGRISRVISRYQFLDDTDYNFMATTSLKASRLIRDNFSAPEAVAVMRRGIDGDWTYNEKTIPLNGYWANEDLFKVFSFRLLKGNPESALRDANNVVLTVTAAAKLFGKEEAMGKTVSFAKDLYTVAGIMQDPPAFSNIKFEMLVSLKSAEVRLKENDSNLKWDNVWDTWVYLLLPTNTDMTALKAELDALSVKEDPTVANTHIELALQQMDEIMLGADLGNQIGPVVGGSELWIFGALSFVVVLSACFNYTNLSIARSLRRTKEVGIRKVVGALRGHVIGQFLAEAVIISICSLAFAFLLFLLVRPFFLGLNEDLAELYQLELTLEMVLYFILFALVVGISAGVFPALFFSRINAVNVLKNFISVPVFKKLTMRRVLIVFQYCISIILITASVIVYKQYKHFISYDLGFRTANVLNISLHGNKPALIKKDLLELPEVKGISQSLIVTSVGNYWGTNMKYHANPDDSAGVYYNTVDENYLPLHGHTLVAGRNFSAQTDSARETEVIVAENVLKRFSIAGRDPGKAIDEIVRVDRKDLKIIGVLKDFSYGRANNKNTQNEVVIRYSATNANWLNVKIETEDILATYGKIEAIWKQHDQVHPFEAQFYDEQIEEAFSGLKAALKMAGVLSVLAISIASLGLLGMVVFTTETRVKEISIRKVLGASESGLLILLGRGFLFLLAIAAAISLPLTYLFFERIAFEEMANPAPISFLDMVAGMGAIVVVACLMIGSQTMKVVKTNPAEVLKTE